VEAEEIIGAIAEAVEAERLAKQKANAANQYQEPSHNKLCQGTNEPANKTVRETAHKAAELFNTNRTYVNEASAQPQH
jgi:hypothetical protein